MRKRRPHALVATGAGALLALGLSAQAGAHISIPESEQAAGAYTVLTFGIPHGCGSSPTTEIEIQIPDSITSVTPTRNPFYDVSVETETLDEPLDGSHGEPISERDAVVVYTAREPLPADRRDAVQLSLQIPADAAGTTLYFPTVQTCPEGTEAWIEIPTDGQNPHELDYPAPSVRVAESTGDDHGHGDGHDGDDHGVGNGDDADGADTGDDVTAGAQQDAAPAESGDDGPHVVAVIALVVGALGLAAGTSGLIAGRRKG